jgi:transposase
MKTPSETELSGEPAACPNCDRLQCQLTSALARIEALEAEVRRGKRQAAPFSRGAPKSNPKPPGRRPGEGKFRSRAAPPPEEIASVIPVPLGGCPECGGALTEHATHTHHQVDLPEVRPLWTRYETESGYCAHCRKRVHARAPGQISRATGAAGISVGPRAKALSSELKHRLGVPYAKISDLFRSAFGLDITPSALSQADARLAGALEPIYQELQQAVRAALSVHVDETGWRVGTLSAWLWVFTGEEATLYTIDPHRSHEVVLRVLGKDFPGVLQCDCFSAYDHHALSEWIQQKCLAHLLKDLSRMEREKRGAAVLFPRAVAALLREALELKRQQSTLDLDTYCARWEKIELELDQLVAESRRFSDADNARFARRLRKQRRHLFLFLFEPGVEATNNRAERAIRPAVITRKTGGCNKTERGARTHAVLASILVTLKQQGIRAADYLPEVLLAPGAPPPLLLPRASPA